MPTLRIATRSSAQARAQSEYVAGLIVATSPDVAIEYVYVDTQGDLNASTPLHQMGGQGVFVKEVQRAVLDGRADIAIHSAKDLPSQQAEGLVIGAVGERRTPNDALVGKSLKDLAQGATVATGSVRRKAQLSRIRPDLQFVDLRGNIQTRLSKVPENGAIVMAIAALEILQLTDNIAEVLPLDVAVPMVGQGSVAVEARVNDTDTLNVLSRIDHEASRKAVEAERAFLAELGAGCSMPVAAHFTSSGVFHAFMASEDGNDTVQIEGVVGDEENHLDVGVAAAVECRRLLAERKTK
jgi:hydroxymethylbilane synthase